MNYFCTYFDQNYLPRALALYRSLTAHGGAFQLWALCMDDTSYATLHDLALPGLHLIAWTEFEEGDQGLLEAKQNRTLIEYYFTCTPSLLLYVFEHHPEVDLITYIDADLFFYADLTPIYTEIGAHSTAIIPHRFAPQLRHLESRGVYNVGWLSFRRDTQGLACLEWWRQQCLDWCYDRVEPTRYADQKYLDQFPHLFENVIVLTHKGANLAPWNIANYTIRTQGTHIMVDDQPLIFYHFHGFKQINGWLYNPALFGYTAYPTAEIRRLIYEPYIRALNALSDSGKLAYGIREAKRNVWWKRIWHQIVSSARIVRGIAEGRYIFFVNHKVL